MNFDYVKKSGLENTIDNIAWAIMAIGAFVCAVLMLGSCADLSSYSGSAKTEAWTRVGIGLGIFGGSLAPWAILRALAEILVLLKAQNGKKEID